MKAKELMSLMIGDIFMAYHDDGETQHYFPVIVDGLDENGTLVEGESYVSWKPLLKEDDYEEYADELNPIPLTPEILEKNGWEKEDISTICVEYTNILGCCDMMVRITNGNAYLELSIFHGSKISMNIQYIHELQHALRLCGLNELADGFKV